jgi:hypothetical protein
MNKKYLTALITSIVGIGIVVYCSTVVYKNDSYGVLGIAVAMAIELFILLLVGIGLLVNPDTKPIGQGMLLGALITLLIGFGICTSV